MIFEQLIDWQQSGDYEVLLRLCTDQLRIRVKIVDQFGPTTYQIDSVMTPETLQDMIHVASLDDAIIKNIKGLLDELRRRQPQDPQDRTSSTGLAEPGGSVQDKDRAGVEVARVDTVPSASADASSRPRPGVYQPLGSGGDRDKPVPRTAPGCPVKPGGVWLDLRDGHLVLNRGKYRGMRLSFVAKDNPGYLQWILDSATPNDDNEYKAIDEALLTEGGDVREQWED